MSNTFVSPTSVVRDAALILNDELIVGNLVNRNVEQQFAQKVGATVYVKVPPQLGTADEFSSTTSASDLTETSTSVTLSKHFYKRVDLTSDELTENVDDFTTLVVGPAVRALTRSVEDYLVARICAGFTRNLTGTAGTSPSTQAHILAAEKTIFNNRGDVNGLVGVISGTSHASFAALAQFTSADYGQDRPMGLMNNTLGKLAGIQFYRSPNVGTFDRGTYAGTVLVNGTTAAGLAALPIDGLSSATGTMNEGTRFTIAGDATVYTVTANATIASNATTLSITPVLAAQATNDTALTFVTAQTEDVIYNPRSVAAAIIPGAVMGPNVAAATVNGVGLRIISDVSTSTLAGSWVFDLYCGCRVVFHQDGTVVQG